MGWTKKEYIIQAYEEIGLAAYVYDLTPEQLQSALRRLDSMMAGWNASGIRIGWQLPSKPDLSDVNTQTSVPDAANEAIYSNLAVRLCASFGKVPSPELKQLAVSSYGNLLSQVSDEIPQRQLPSNMPVGAGNKSRENSFFSPLTQQLEAGQDGNIIME